MEITGLVIVLIVVAFIGPFGFVTIEEVVVVVSIGFELLAVVIIGFVFVLFVVLVIGT